MEACSGCVWKAEEMCRNHVKLGRRGHGKFCGGVGTGLHFEETVIHSSNIFTGMKEKRQSPCRHDIHWSAVDTLRVWTHGTNCYTTKGVCREMSTGMWERATGNGDRIPNGQRVSSFRLEPNPEHRLSARPSEPGRGKEEWKQ